MTSRIVVGTDGSDTAQKAVAAAIDLAHRTNATLDLVAAFRPPSGGESELSKDATDALLVEAVAHITDLTIKTHAIAASPADAIVKVAEEVGADLIVVGSKGMQGVQRVLGSVPNKIAHKAPCDVLIVKTS